MKNMSLNADHKAVLLLIYTALIFCLCPTCLFSLVLPCKPGTMIQHKMVLCNTVTSLDCGRVCSYQGKQTWSIAEKRSSSSHIVLATSPRLSPLHFNGLLLSLQSGQKELLSIPERRVRYDTPHIERPESRGGTAVTNGWMVFSIPCSYQNGT